MEFYSTLKIDQWLISHGHSSVVTFIKLKILRFVLSNLKQTLKQSSCIDVKSINFTFLTTLIPSEF